jgi:hypothetical protein
VHRIAAVETIHDHYDHVSASDSRLQRGAGNTVERVAEEVDQIIRLVPARECEAPTPQTSLSLVEEEILRTAKETMVRNRRSRPEAGDP